jgi:Leucine-rich repeat (LRR) protein
LDANKNIQGHKTKEGESQAMKKVIVIIMVILLTITVAACAAPAVESIAQTAQETKPEVVIFNDTVLENKVRAAMGKSEGDIRFSEAEAVKELNLSNQFANDMPDEIMIKDISSLAYFVNLKDLGLSINAVSDISVLSKLTKLFNLQLQSNMISDLSPLSSLKNLVILELRDNQITDVSAISGLKSLELLSLAGNMITDFSPLKDIYPNLKDADFEILLTDDIPDESIEISDPNLEAALRKAMGITDRPITRKDAYLVQTLQLSQQNDSEDAISDIGALSYFVNLKELYMDGNDVSDLSPIAGLSKLKVLTFEWNEVTDLSPIAGLTQLEQLAAKQNGFSDISALAGLTEMWELVLCTNQISDVSPLAGLINLKALLLAENPITDFSPLNDIYPNLENPDFELN